MKEIMPHWLKKQSELNPNGLAIETANKSWTFAELNHISKEYAYALLQKGVKKGDKVGIISGNNPQFIFTVHAISYIGAIAVLINTRLTEAEMGFQLKDADVTYILTDEKHEYMIQQAIWSKSIPSSTFYKLESVETVSFELRQEIAMDEGFTMMYTSGTTGIPKAVPHTYGNHFWSAVGSMLNLGLNQTDKWLSVLPMFHIGGLSIYFKSVIYGIPVYLLEKFSANDVIHSIQHNRVTMMSSVTVMLERILTSLGERALPDWFRCMLLGGGPAPKSLLVQAKMQNVPVFQSYGLTETSSQIVTLSPKDALERIGSSGKPLFPAQLKIINPNQKGEGEIVVKGPMVVNGYCNNTEATEKTLVDGWFSTGDIGVLDEEGFLYVLDRRKDLIISGGENVYPAEVEHVLFTVPGVHEAGVIGVKDSVWGQVPAAFIVGDSLDLQEVEANCKSKLAPYKRPKYFWLIDELPRNASGKLLRRKLVELSHNFLE